MTYNKIYYPYKSDKPEKKFFIITNTGKKVYFGAANYEHFTEGHLDDKRKERYIRRHEKRENWNDPNTKGFWSYKFLWLYPSYSEAYDHIKKDLKNKGYI